MNVAAVILAAGEARRMGCAKQLLPVGGQPMLLHVVQAVLAAQVDDVIVVLGAQAAAIQPLLAGQPVSVVLNEQWRAGMASSLRAGLALVSPHADAALFVPADMPQIQPATMQAIVARFYASRAPIVIPVCGGRRGNPVLFARALFPELAALRGEQGGRVLFASHYDDIATLQTDDEGILRDVDTPDDYARLSGGAALP